jgi:2-polyprenyl-3-methyl-5-hydroxy-6-metoxy-1,4-benzoquinol methylase
MTEQEFTGERFVPGQGGFQIAYEHLHRYAFAEQLAQGKIVLDVACGSGYGARVLARQASRVLAFDIEPAVVSRLSADEAVENLELLAARAEQVPLRSGVVDLVTAFEVIEHVQHPEELVREAARVVRPGGIVLISTPNKAVYTDARDYRNAYHVKEFYREEFLELLRSNFSEVRLLTQQLRAGSVIATGGEAAGSGVVLTTGPLPDVGRTVTEPMYFLAACTPQPVDLAIPAVSIYLDLSDGLLQEWEHRYSATLKEIDRVNAELRRVGQWGRQLESDIHARDEALVKTTRRFESDCAARDRTIRALQREMRLEMERRDQQIDQLKVSLEERLRWVRSLEGDVASRDEQILAAYRELESVSQQLATIQHSLPYRVLRRLRVLPD